MNDKILLQRMLDRAQNIATKYFIYCTAPYYDGEKIDYRFKSKESEARYHEAIEYIEFLKEQIRNVNIR